MRFQGRIKSWNKPGGFGFIRWNGGSDEVYVHVTAFADRRREPMAGDIVSYSVGKDANGRHRAEQVEFAGRRATIPSPIGNSRDKPDFPWFGAIAAALGLAVCAVLFLRFRPQPPPPPPEAVALARPTQPRPVEEPRFRCEGKTRCPEMTSCAEAVFYLKNCPGSLSDGDGDGIPCEDQWCGH